MFDTVREFWDYRSMAWNLAKREVRGRYKGSLLGFLWNLITPIIQMLVYIMVFTVVFKVDIEYYPIYLISGMVPWILFSESLQTGSSSIVTNSDSVKKIYFPRSVLPVSVVLSKFVNYVISMAIVLAIIVISGFGLSWEALLCLPLYSLLLLLFSMGISLVLSCIDVYFRDVEHIVTVILMAVIWLTPIMYTLDHFDDVVFNTILAVNPMTYFVEMAHDILYFKCIPDLLLIVTCVGITAVSLIIGWLVFNHLEKDFAEEI